MAEAKKTRTTKAATKTVKEAAPKTAAKKTAAKKTETKTEAAKKTTARTRKAAVKENISIQFAGREYTKEQLQSCYAAFSVRASEINRAEGRQHYRIAKIAELNQIVIIAETEQ